MPNPENISAVLGFISGYVKANNVPPSIQEIANGCYLSKTETHRILTLLKATEKISMQTGKHRTIRIIK